MHISMLYDKEYTAICVDIYLTIVNKLWFNLQRCTTCSMTWTILMSMGFFAWSKFQKSKILDFTWGASCSKLHAFFLQTNYFQAWVIWKVIGRKLDVVLLNILMDFKTKIHWTLHLTFKLHDRRLTFLEMKVTLRWLTLQMLVE